MKDKILDTDGTCAPLALRVILGLVVFPHGAQKLFGWFGGYGLTGTLDFFANTVGLPWIVAFVVIMLESIGAIALIFGFATRILASLFIILALGIVFTSHLEHGFFMNWFGNQSGEGYEFFLLWIGMAVALVITGGGRFSMDRTLVSSEFLRRG